MIEADRLGIVFVTWELSPYRKNTGVADLLKTVISDLRKRGIPVGIIAPDFNIPQNRIAQEQPISLISTLSGSGSESILIHHGIDEEGVHLFIVNGPEYRKYFSEESSSLTEDQTGRMCLKFCYSAYLLIDLLASHRGPLNTDKIVVHAFHWQSGPLMELLRRKEFPIPVKTVMTADILDRQGLFDSSILEAHEIFRHLQNQSSEINFLKLGLESSDILHTVSPNFAREIQTPPHGRGLEKLFNQRFEAGRLIGILNGLSHEGTSWDTITEAIGGQEATEPNGADLDLIMRWKSNAKLFFQKQACLSPNPDSFLISMGHRFVKQKNFEVVGEALPKLMELDPRPQIYLRTWPEPEPGDNNWDLWLKIVRLAKRYRFNVAFLSPFDRAEELTGEGIFIDRNIYYAASDLFLMPSIWEPCGLCQLEAMRFGAIPVVNPVGGLADTVKSVDDGPDGWGFWLKESSSPQKLVEVVAEAMDTWKSEPEKWRGMVKRALNYDSKISVTVDRYLEFLYGT